MFVSFWSQYSLRSRLAVGTSFALFALWLYTGFMKLIHLDEFMMEVAMSPLLAYIEIPRYGLITMATFEILVAVLLLMKPTQIVALYASLLMMLAYTVYLIVLVTAFSNIPCACGGILGGMSYPVHIAFNIFFTLVALVGIYTSDAKPTIEPQVS
jgi:hypothetical protein